MTADTQATTQKLLEAMTGEDTEDFMCAAAVAICGGRRP
jgi:hypothetical protein